MTEKIVRNMKVITDQGRITITPEDGYKLYCLVQLADLQANPDKEEELSFFNKVRLGKNDTVINYAAADAVTQSALKNSLEKGDAA